MIFISCLPCLILGADIIPDLYMKKISRPFLIISKITLCLVTSNHCFDLV